jgi:outer membrane protein assembly factor BamB
MEKRKRPVFWQGPILAGGRLILTNSLGQIVEASPEDGRVLSTTAASDTIDVAPIVADGTLYILANDGTLSAYR